MATTQLPDGQTIAYDEAGPVNGALAVCWASGGGYAVFAPALSGGFDKTHG